MPRRTIPSCSCGWLCSGTVAPGSNSIRFSIAPSPNSGRPETPAASSNARTSSKRTNCGSIRRDYRSTSRDRRSSIDPSSCSATGVRRRRWVDADSGATFPVVNPATGETIADVPRMGAAETRRAIEAAAARAARLAHTPGQGARCDPAPPRRPDDRPRRGARRAARRSSRASRSPRRGSRSRTPPRSTSGSARRRSALDGATIPSPWPDRRHRRAEGAGRRHGRDHAVELPLGDGHAQVRAGARRRLHDGAEAGRADAALGAGRGRAGRGGRPAAGRPLDRHRRRRGRARDRRRDDLEPARAQARLHRLDRGREAAHARSARHR